MKLTCLKPRLPTASTSRLTGLVAAPPPRESAHQRGYGYKWRKARLVYLRKHPLCVFCEREGRVTEATVIDHKIPHGGNQTLFWDEGNWMALCKPCHDVTKAKIEHDMGYRG